MIGNKILFVYYDWSEYGITHRDHSKEPPIIKGLVVDAFTDIKGSVSGRSSSFLGIGDGSVSGSTKSKRMYKVEYFSEYDKEEKDPQYTDIHDWQLRKILSFANNPDQERNEEKFVNT